jgi:predicted MPP superfamily phosphohydrolase
MHKEVFYTKKNIKDCKIAIFSDLHYYPGYPKKILDKIIKQIKDSKVDYIAILGDILDSSNYTELSPLKDFLTSIANIAPTMVILGNHERKAGYRHNWYNEENEALLKILKSTKNLYLLDDSNYQHNNINFYGFSLSFEYYDQDEPYEIFVEEAKNLKDNLEDKNYNITLIHSPINIYKYLEEYPEYNLNKTDLILSGHMHNGCLPFWFSNTINKIFHTSRSIISPSGKLFPKYSQGRIYKRDGYVYQGISKLSK